MLDTALLRETTNGLRIKTYQVIQKKIASIFTRKLFISLCTLLEQQGGSGYVQDVRFTNVEMQDVSNPILIDQFYCDNPTSCQNQVSLQSQHNLVIILKDAKLNSDNVLFLFLGIM